MSHRRIVGLCEENAAAWDRMRGRDLHEAPWLERFAAALPAGGALLDIGCGMGEPVARWFIERGFAVTGIDTSPSLLAMARERFPAHEWIAADMRMLDLGRRFDGAIAWHSLFHLSDEDQPPMFARFAAHLKRGAPLMFTSGDAAETRIGEWLGEPLYHCSLAPGDYRALMKANGFARIAARRRDPGGGGATVWLAIRT
jgi:SAM-dependent methyltransferase